MNKKWKKKSLFFIISHRLSMMMNKTMDKKNLLKQDTKKMDSFLNNIKLKTIILCQSNFQRDPFLILQFHKTKNEFLQRKKWKKIQFSKESIFWSCQLTSQNKKKSFLRLQKWIFFLWRVFLWSCQFSRPKKTLLESWKENKNGGRWQVGKWWAKWWEGKKNSLEKKPTIITTIRTTKTKKN